MAFEALDQLLDCLWLVALRLEDRCDDKLLAAFGFLRTWRAMRGPPGRGGFGPALAQKPFKGLPARHPSTASRLRREVGARGGGVLDVRFGRDREGRVLVA